MTSPKSILRSPSPRGVSGGLKKNCEQVAGCVGLGIVAALEKFSGSGHGEIVAKFLVGSPNLNHNRSVPIPILVHGGGGGGSSKPTATARRQPRAGADDLANDYRKRGTSSVFSESSPPTTICVGGGGGGGSAILEIPAFPTPDFLSSCHLCRKKLQGRDIYMYRGEKAFCSIECRYQQIVTDEGKEKCRTEASRPHEDLSASPYTNSTRLFSPGIIAV